MSQGRMKRSWMTTVSNWAEHSGADPPASPAASHDD